MSASPFALIGATLSDPPGTAARLLSLRLPMRSILEAALAAAALSGLASGLVSGGQVELDFGTGTAYVLSPLTLALMSLAWIVVGAMAVTMAGRALGGQGQFEGALLLMAWLAALDVAIQLAQILLIAALPPLAALVLIAGLATILWCALGFVRALHGLGAGRALAAILLALVGSGLLLGMVMTALGLGVPSDA